MATPKSLSKENLEKVALLCMISILESPEYSSEWIREGVTTVTDAEISEDDVDKVDEMIMSRFRNISRGLKMEGKP